MAPPHLRVLFFDVFGTCVEQRRPVADALWNATQEALKSKTSTMSSEVRERATKMSYDEWFDFGAEWNKEEDKIKRESIAKHDNVDWQAVDKNRIDVLPKLLAKRGLIVPKEGTEEFTVGEGSLWDDSQLQYLGRIWHRLTPWPDTCRGLELLNQKMSTVTLSNTYQDLIEGLVAHSNIPFQHVYSSEMFNSYKPNPKVYLGAAEKMGVKPDECALVAAHLSDLKGAKACGFYAINVVRPLEEKSPELEKEGIPDMRIEEGDGGFVTLAKRLGIEAD